MRNAKWVFSGFVLLLINTVAFPQQLKLGKNPYVITKSAVLELESSNQGLLFPRVADTSQINTLVPPDGMVIFHIPSLQLLLRTGGYWKPLSVSLALNSYWSTIGNSVTSSTINFLGTTDAQDLVFKANNIERLRIANGVSASTGTAGDIVLGDANSGTFRSNREMVMREDGDTHGPSILRLRNRDKENGAIFETIGSSEYLVDFIFKTGTAASPLVSNIRFETRNGPYLKVSGNTTEWQFGQPDYINGGPTLVIGASGTGSNSALRIGNFGIGTTSPSEKIDVAGNVKFSGALMPGNVAGNAGYFLTSTGAGTPPTWNAFDTISITGFSQKVRSLFAATAPITYSNGLIGITQATTSTNGYLSSTDWTTFNNKQTALTLGNVTASDLTITGGTGAVIGSGLSMALATVNANTGVFGSTTLVPQITVNGKGLITAVAPQTIAFPVRSVNTLTGNVSLGISNMNDATITTPTTNQVLQYSGTRWINTTPSYISSAITSLNGLTAATQTFATPGTSGTAPFWSSTASAHTLNIPLATASGVTAGLLSNADYSIFNNKVGSISLGGNVVEAATTFSVSGVAATGLRTLNTQIKNTIFSGPASGVDAIPTFRILTPADIPIATITTVGGISVGSGLAITAGGVVSATNTNSGTVTTVSASGTQGVTVSVATPSTTPALSIGLGAINPTSVAATGTVTGSNLSGTNTGDQTITLTSDVTGTGTGSFATTIGTNVVTYAKMQQVAASKLLGNFTGSLANASEISLGTGLSFVGSTLTYTPSASGTVTSVGLLLPSIFSITNSPITSSGTLTGTLNTQSANLIFAGPATGIAATPTFRSLAAADLPLATTTTVGGISVGTGLSITAGVLSTTSAAPSGTAGGDLTGNYPNPTLATVNSNTGTFGSTTVVPQITVNGKGLITAVASQTIAFPVTSVNTLTGAVSLGISNMNDATITTPTANQVLQYSGTRWVNTTPSYISSAITSLNGLTAATQTFATPGTSGTAPFWSSTASAHTLNIPFATAAGVTAGLLSNADYSIFNNKVGSISLGGNVVEAATTFSVSGGDATGSRTLNTQIKNTIFSGPASGVDSIPTFRILMPADIPIATTTTVGGISVGTGLSVSGSGVLSSSINTGNFWNITGNSGTLSTTNFLGTTDGQDLVFKANNTERLRIANGVSASTGTAGDIVLGDAISGTLRSNKELVIREDGDIYGPSILRLRNRNGENGVIFETIGAAANLVDFLLKTGTAAAPISSNIRFETRGASIKLPGNTTEWQIGQPDVVNGGPTLVIGAWGTGSKSALTIGNFGIGTTSPSEKLDITGNVRFSGALMPGNIAGTSGFLLTSAGAGVAPTWSNPANLITSNAWSITGNTGTTSGTNFIGTTDIKSLVMRTNNLQGLILDSLGNIGVGLSPVFTASPNREKLLVDAGTNTANNYINVVSGKGSTNNYLQVNIQNRSAGTAASSDIVATNDLGTESINYIDMGINSSGFATGAITGAPNTAYLYATGNDFVIGNSSSGKPLRFYTTNTSSTSTDAMRIDSDGKIGIATSSPNSTFSVNGSVTMKFFTVSTTTYSVSATDYIVLNTGAASTWTLPAASSCAGRVYKLINHGTANVTLSPAVRNSSAVAATTTLSNVAGSNSLEILSDGTYWRVIN